MKISHIIAIIFIAVTIGVIYTTVSGSGRYADFTEAFNNPGKKYTIIGKLNRDKAINEQPNKLEFYMVDEKKVERKVCFNDSKPQDFERSENIVMTGTAKGNEFHATEILLKCPSKYNDMNK